MENFDSIITVSERSDIFYTEKCKGKMRIVKGPKLTRFFSAYYPLFSRYPKLQPPWLTCCFLSTPHDFSASIPYLQWHTPPLSTPLQNEYQNPSQPLELLSDFTCLQNIFWFSGSSYSPMQSVCLLQITTVHMKLFWRTWTVFYVCFVASNTEPAHNKCLINI